MRFLSFAAVVVFAASVGFAAEPWADSRLPESAKTGLVLWLDAAAQNAARKALGRPELSANAALPTWFDSSGKQRHLGQENSTFCPTLQTMQNGLAIRFDGADDFLILNNERLELKNLTLVVVAAPYSNAGMFRALFAGAERGKNDYTTGLNFDLGPWFSAKMQFVNAEGPGFGGAVNLLSEPVDFGKLHRLMLVAESGANGVKLFVNGKQSGARNRSQSAIRLDQMVVGARIYSNEAKPPYVQGFLDGDIAEVMLFDHALDDEQRKAVEHYLAAKYANVVPVPPMHVTPAGSRSLVTVKDPPPVQMFLPGFLVRKLPVDLPNINNIRYRPDGKLVALGYNGTVYLLSDSDNDGLEDTVRPFWENKGEIQSPIGMALTPPNYPLGQGVIVACKGKVVLLADTDGDDRADKEIIVADKWESYPPEMNTHGVDALGVAVGKDGSIYFGLGCKSYVNGYMIDKDGKSRYDLKSERGTILRVSPDFKKREIIATGIRFPVGLAFNRDGDLFATDQEGATWLPNGNPFDELLHIQPGRHYGFPPRHPKHLPIVIDEPSTFDYSPQHQSICGLTFNESKAFGPPGWAGDALLAGYSRGKIYRTKLVKTESGYVAQNQLIACLNMLAADLAVSNEGALVVAAHSGGPDWGSGPAGKGKLFQIVYDGQSLPQPVLAWAGSPGEVRIAFDKPLDPKHLSELTKNAVIEYGKYVRAGDRFETLRPGYSVVQQQLGTPRYDLPILSASVTPDRRTLILTTAAHPEAAHYALTLPGLGRPAKPTGQALRQHSQIDLDYDLCGVQAEWRSNDGKENWSGWLPHLDMTVNYRLTSQSYQHRAMLLNVDGVGYALPGRWNLKTKLDLWQLLRPAVQPGSPLDHTWPPEKVTLTFTSNQRITIRGQDAPIIADRRLELTVVPQEGKPIPLEIEIEAARGELSLQVAYHTAEDPRLRPLPLHRFLLPWATLKRSASEAAVRETPELKGGNWVRGRQIFFSEESQCSKCHRVRGEGGAVGPDLSNLVHRDYDSVLRDIRFPSAAINPDHLTYVVELKNGRSFAGVLKQQGDTVRVVDGAGRETNIRASDIDSMTPATVSTMPDGIDRILGPEKLRDLLMFLLTDSLAPAALEIPGEPPPRRRSEVEAVLKRSDSPKGPFDKIHIVLCTGPKDHGPGEHDYPLWRRRWTKLFDLHENVLISTADNWPTIAQLEKANLIVFYSNNPSWNAQRATELDAFLRRGGGAVFIHYAVDGHRHVDELASLIGLAWKGGASRFRHGPLDLKFDGKHPISMGFERVKFIDESYWRLTGNTKSINVLAVGSEDGADQPLFWTREHGKGRVFVSIPGHYNWTFDDPLFRLLLLRGMAWAAHQPIDRFRPLIWPGARITPGEER